VNVDATLQQGIGSGQATNTAADDGHSQRAHVALSGNSVIVPVGGILPGCQ
jgi:hypothetical protein